jgi:hypothetical protein
LVPVLVDEHFVQPPKMKMAKKEEPVVVQSVHPPMVPVLLVSGFVGTARYHKNTNKTLGCQRMP